MGGGPQLQLRLQPQNKEIGNGNGVTSQYFESRVIGTGGYNKLFHFSSHLIHTLGSFQDRSLSMQ